MRALRAWGLRLASLFAAARRDEDLRAEIESHLPLHTDDNIRAGMSPAQARRTAVLQLGGVEARLVDVRPRSSRAWCTGILLWVTPAMGFPQEMTSDALVGGPRIQQQETADSAAVRRLREIQQELIKAWLQQDRPTIEGLLAPDWTVTGPTGVTSTRAQILDDAFERRIHRLLSGTVTDVSVRLIGSDAAIVMGHTQATGTYDGVRYSADIRFTDVFERHGENWRAVRSHASSIGRK